MAGGWVLVRNASWTIAKVFARAKIRRYHEVVRSYSVLICCLALLCTLPVRGQSIRGTSLGFRVAPECSIGFVSLGPGVPKTQTLTFNYKLRTSDTGGQGQIILRFMSSPAGNFVGADTLDYQTSLAGPGTPSSGSVATQG